MCVVFLGTETLTLVVFFYKTAIPLRFTLLVEGAIEIDDPITAIQIVRIQNAVLRTVSNRIK